MRGDVALFYLPYVKEAIGFDPTIRIVCLKRPREEVVTAFCRTLDQATRFATNHGPGSRAQAGRTISSGRESFRSTTRRIAKKDSAAIGTSITTGGRAFAAASRELPRVGYGSVDRRAGRP